MKALGCLSLLLLFLQIAPAGNNGKADGLATFQGQWRLTGARDDGKEIEISGLTDLKIVFKGDKILINGEPKFKVTVDTTCTPKIIDLTIIDDGRVAEGIYRFKGTTLTICLHDLEGARMRPLAFNEAGVKVFMLDKVKGD